MDGEETEVQQSNGDLESSTFESFVRHDRGSVSTGALAGLAWSQRCFRTPGARVLAHAAADVSTHRSFRPMPTVTTV